MAITAVGFGQRCAGDDGTGTPAGPKPIAGTRTLGIGIGRPVVRTARLSRAGTAAAARAVHTIRFLLAARP